MTTKTKKTTLRLGSVSHGTLREEDLIPTCIDLADSLRLSKAERQKVRDISRRFHTRTSFESLATDYFRNGESTEDLNTLTDVLDCHVPDYCYFGTHEGDGADFGVWINPGVFDGEYDDMVSRSAVAPGNDLRDYWLEVNDHGNGTLYKRVGRTHSWRAVWSVV